MACNGSTENEDMEEVLMVNLPYPVADLQKIERHLESRDCIVHFSPTFERYSTLAYHYEAARHDQRHHVLFDLNVLSALISLAKGEKAASDTMRDVAALMAFLIPLNCLIEPGMSAQEYSVINGEEQARENLRLFYQADNVEPSIYADIACGRRKHLVQADLPEIPKDKGNHFRADIAKPYWQHYASLLKLGIIMNSPGSPVDKFKRYLEWQRDEFFFDGCASLLAVQSLGTRPIKDPFKQNKYRYRHDPLKGVRNAAWDMSMAKYWSQRAFQDREKNIQWLFCSFDANLRELAKYLMVADSIDKNTQLRELVAIHWHPRDIDAVMSCAIGMESVLGDKDRATRVRETKNAVPHLVKSLEAEFLNTRHQ